MVVGWAKQGQYLLRGHGDRSKRLILSLQAFNGLEKLIRVLIQLLCPLARWPLSSNTQQVPDDPFHNLPFKPSKTLRESVSPL